MWPVCVNRFGSNSPFPSCYTSTSDDIVISLADVQIGCPRLQTNCKEMQRDELQLQEEIKKLTAERQEFITKARRERMPDEEFIPQIGALYDKELGVKRRLTAIEQEKDAFAAIDLEEQVKKNGADLLSEMAELINANPQTPEERHQVFLKKKRIVDTILVEASIDENREIHVKFRTDFLNLAGPT